MTKKNYIAKVGRRKTAVARVRLFKTGEGKIVINEKECDKYFDTVQLTDIAKRPLLVVNLMGKVDISVKVSGGGKNSQAESVSLGISRALVEMDAELKGKLKKAGLLKRDPRKKERKKPGLKRARRAPQWSKR